MNTPARLSLYGLGLIGAFGAAFLLSGAIVPDDAVDARLSATEEDHGAHVESTASETGAAAMPGLSLEADGYILTPVEGPSTVDEVGELSFSVLDVSGEPVLEYTEVHEKELHLIVVREDGSEFRHVHPEVDAAGTWSIPWSWDAAGSYRVFADFSPGDADSGVTLTRSVSVAGQLTPVNLADDAREARAADFDVTLSGELVAGESSTLTLEVTRDGEAVTTMQPYLGAFGHLVALRDGDLAYLHVHPEGAEPEPGQSSGPTVEFATEAPTAGRYLLYFDFQVDGEVHTASFVVTASGSATGDAPQQAPGEVSLDEAPADEHDDSDGHDDSGEH
ncbi:heavy-metal-associated domain-containing protein [Agrococcus sp. 1P02AA]|uniref:heavy-metal-associated domain-containing protein n=1 Tax=Agrococcus sp. 1P02AA TaxID=3132259 RepID=UPI0039A57C06